VSRIRAELPRITGTQIIENAQRTAAEIIADAEAQRKAIVDKQSIIIDAKARHDKIVKEALEANSAIEENVRQNLTALLTHVQTTLSDANKGVTGMLGFLKKEN